MNILNILLSGVVMIMATGCAGVIAYTQSMTTDATFQGPIGVFLPLGLCVCIFLAGVTASGSGASTGLPHE